MRQDMACSTRCSACPPPGCGYQHLAGPGSPLAGRRRGGAGRRDGARSRAGAAITIVLIKPRLPHTRAGGVAAAVAALRLAVPGRPSSRSAPPDRPAAKTATPGRGASPERGAAGRGRPPRHRCRGVRRHRRRRRAVRPGQGLIGGSFPPVKEVNLPASDPLVLAAGGTTLIASHKTGGYIGETAWGLPYGSRGTAVPSLRRRFQPRVRPTQLPGRPRAASTPPRSARRGRRRRAAHRHGAGHQQRRRLHDQRTAAAPAPARRSGPG